MADPGPLQFDHADHGSATPQSIVCAGCGRAVIDLYYEVGGRTLCAACRQQLATHFDPGAGIDRFLLALGLGTAAAAAGALLWYAVRWLTNLEVGLIAIAVGYLVGRAVHHGSRGRGGFLYQSLAVTLTYLAIASTYVPEILKQAGGDSPLPDVVRLGLVFVSACIAPFLGGFENIIGLLIIFFGLSQAWRMNRRMDLQVSGPFRVGASVPGPAPASA